MNKKYYTPKIEEFYNNFEYEYLQDSKWSTEGFTIYSPILVADVLHKLKNQKIRVKYLDKWDFEECGFFIEKEDNYSFVRKKTLSRSTSDNNWIKITTHEENRFIDITREYCDGGSVHLFSGFIPNKSELEKLLKKINVEIVGFNEQPG